MNKPIIEKDYIGDGVYVDFDGYHIVLTAENGVYATDTIALEPPVFEALLRFNARLQEAIEHHRNNPTKQ